MAVSTARIPELSALTTGLPLNMADQLPIFISSENKTKKVSLEDLNTFFNLGGGGTTHPPVSYGGEVIVKISAGQAGGHTVSIPSLAGKDFTLERMGVPLEPLLEEDDPNYNPDTYEYEVLDAGGFLLNEDTTDPLVQGERFKLTVYSLIGGNDTGTGTTAAPWLRGAKLVSTNESLDPADDINKVIQLRGSTTALAITLPDVDDVEANGFFIFESNITNTKPSAIATTGGQFIYLNTTSKTTIHMHPGEVLWLYRKADGWYVINDFWRVYRGIGIPYPVYQAELGELVCKGQTVNRADYPRLWEKVQTLGSSLVSDTVWNTANVYRQGNTYTTTVPGSGTYETIPNPYRGCFSTGDGSTTFRLPDFRNMAIRGVKDDIGSDVERYQGTNRGMYQKHMLEAHTHTTDLRGNSAGDGFFTKNDGSGGQSLYPTSSTGGAETRMDNIGMLYVIKF